jgi:isoamylase
VRCVAALLDGRLAASRPGDSVLLLFNASMEPVSFTLPDATVAPGGWTVRVNTGQVEVDPPNATRVEDGGKFELQAHAMALLTQKPEEAVHALPA